MTKDNGKAFIVDVFDEYLFKIYASRVKIIVVFFLGIALSLLTIFILPQSYKVNLVVERSPLVVSNALIGIIFENTEGEGSAISFKERVEQISGFVDGAVERAVFEPSIFVSAYTRVVGPVDPTSMPELFTDTIQVTRRDSDPRAQNVRPVSFDVSVSGLTREKSTALASAYQEEMVAFVRSDLFSDIQEIVDGKLQLNDVRFRAENEMFVAKSSAEIAKLKNSIRLAQAAGIQNLAIPKDVPMSSQIPLLDAVPKYFFGEQVLRVDLENTEKDISNQVLVPTYAKYIEGQFRLREMVKLLDSSNVKPLVFRVDPEISKRLNGIKKLVIIATFAFLSIFIYLVLIFWAIFRRRMEGANA